MPKRYHDTELKNKDWYLQLEADEKAFFHWITMEQSTAGIWDVNLIIPKRLIPLSKEFSLDSFIEKCNSDGKERMMKVANGKKIFFAPTVEFQQRKNGENITLLNPAVPAHKGVLNQLRENVETKEWLAKQIKEKQIFIGSKDELEGYKSDRLSEKQKDAIKKSDKYTCQYCGSTEKESMQVDHIIPKSSGGDNMRDNLITACEHCNMEKGAKPVIQYIASTGLDPLDNLKVQIQKLFKRGKIPENFQGLAKGIGISIGISKGNNNSNSSNSNKHLLKKPPTPFAEDLKSWLKLYGKDSTHKHLAALWAGLNESEKKKIISRTKLLRTDVKFRKEPYYFLKDKDYEVIEKLEVYKPPSFDGSKYGKVDYEAYKKKNSK